jgi:hypothetical protein
VNGDGWLREDGTMGMIQIQISDDERAALEKAHPGETIEAAVQRLIRAEAARAATSPKASLVERAKAIAQEMKLTLSDDEIRTLRHEGRP